MRVVPKGAHIEAELAPDIVLVNVVGQLPTARGGYPLRPIPVELIDLLASHHSGALGKPGFIGMLRSAQYSTSWKLRRGKRMRPWPGFAYTFWTPFHDVRLGQLGDGPRVMYRGNEDERRTYHTGGVANDRGVANCFQGNLSKTPMSRHQIECAEAFYPWAMKRYPQLTPERLVGHSESKPFGGTGKKACPGPHVLEWVRDFREGWEAA
ncbi:MAG: peptidoglycan recognition family protein [Myxococcota bacterium]